MLQISNMIMAMQLMFGRLHDRVVGERAEGERGATATEYALLVGGIALAIAIAVFAFGGALSDFFDALGDKVGLWSSGTNTAP